MGKKKEVKSEKQKPVSVSPAGISDTSLRKRMAGIILVLCFFLYGNTLWNGYSMDDELVSYNHELVSKGIKGIPDIFTSRYAVNEKQNYEYRPMVLAVYAVEAQFFGQKPATSHFFNILIYALCCFVLFLLLHRLFKNYHWILPVAATLIFLIHPIHTEVVASIKNRDEMLSFLFALFSLWVGLNFAETGKWKYLVFSVLLLGVSMLSKKSSMTFIALIPFTAWFFNVGGIKNKRVIFLFAGLLLVYFIPQLMVKLLVEEKMVQRELLFFENPLYDRSQYTFSDRVPFSFYTLAYYTRLMIFPHPLRVFYGYNEIEMAGWDHPMVWAGVLMVVALVVYGFYKIKTRQAWIFGIFFFFAGMSEFSNLVRPAPGIIAERFTFIPSIGFCIAVAWLLLELTKIPYREISAQRFKWPPSLRIAAVALFLLCSVKIISRNNDWYSHFTIYHHDITYTENSAKLNSLLGSQYVSQLEKEMVKLNAGQPPTLTFQQRKNKTDSALMLFNRALEIYPDYIAVNNNIGAVYFTYVQNYDSAGKYFKRAVELDTDYVQAHFNFASCEEIMLGRYEEMAAFYQWKNKNAASGGKEKTNQVLTDSLGIFFKNFDFLKTRLSQTMNNAFSVLIQNKDFSQAPLEFRKGAETVLSGGFLPVSSAGLDSMCYALAKQTEILYQSMNFSGVNTSVDSISALYLYPFVDSVVTGLYRLNKIASVGFQQADRAIGNFAEEKRKEKFQNMLRSLNRTLFLNPEYVVSYNKLQNIYRERNMGDSMVSLALRSLEYDVYLKSDLFTAIGSGYLMSKNDVQAIVYFDKSIAQLENTVKKLSVMYTHMTGAKNTETSQMVIGYLQKVKRDIINLCEFISVHYNRKGDSANAEKYIIRSQPYRI
ncbi:MAG: glycosyltransferase family 39 protein [Bacteroidota bacterium]